MCLGGSTAHSTAHRSHRARLAGLGVVLRWRGGRRLARPGPLGLGTRHPRGERRDGRREERDSHVYRAIRDSAFLERLQLLSA